MRWKPKKKDCPPLWYAWWPVYCKRDGVWCWLEVVERIEVGTNDYFFWEYNTIGKP